MPGESKRFVPPADKPINWDVALREIEGERMKEERLGREGVELEARAQALLVKFKAMLRRHNWAELPDDFTYEYKHRHRKELGNKGEISSDDEELMEEMEVFFREDCSKVPKIAVAGRSVIKKVADNLFLYKEVTADRDVDIEVYSIIDGGRARELLQRYVEKLCEQIKALEEEEAVAQDELGKIKV